MKIIGIDGYFIFSKIWELEVKYLEAIMEGLVGLVDGTEVEIGD